ncbi:FAD synthase isoform X2 [Cherax quadricarinatus]|uniref:FAD synthase isoform X2 n=1 Tax=Cherax quadricarinatus TaxID=27406 RepID=UPI00387E67F3
MEVLTRCTGGLLATHSIFSSFSSSLATQGSLIAALLKIRLSFLPGRSFWRPVSSAMTSQRHQDVADQLPDSIPTAGLIIIGDEILKGQTQDTNTYFLTRKLHNLGVKISVIPDDVQTIADEVAAFSKQFTFVLTSGGIGPTHDDITFEGVAVAFGEKVHPHPMLVQFISSYFKTDDLSSPAMKMAHIPESAVLHFGEDKSKGIKSRYPIISVRNVTVFPGVPHLLERAFELLGKKLFHTPGMEFCVRVVYLTADEVSIASLLNEVVAEFPSVSFGSYPKLFHSYYKTKITLESLNTEILKEAEQCLRSKLPRDIFIDYKEDTVTSPWEHIDRLLLSSPSLQTPIQEALDILSKCFDRYSAEEICICYNGGKDCLVVLHLAYAMMLRNFPNTKLQAVYITENKVFPQVTEFVQQSINRYDLDCEVIPGPMKGALCQLLKKRPKIKAVIMGTRCSDPYSDTLEFFSATDKDWPPMMRVNAILNWKYNNVWDFIRGLYLPYCSLYDRGYTSLGSQDNTLPNPLLETKDRIGQVMYLPAYQLKQYNMERKELQHLHSLFKSSSTICFISRTATSLLIHESAIMYFLHLELTFPPIFESAGTISHLTYNINTLPILQSAGFANTLSSVASDVQVPGDLP